MNDSRRTGGMRVLHIVAGLPPGGGIAESVPHLCRHLRQLGHEVTLATLDGPISEAALEAEEVGVRLVRFRASRPRSLFFSWQMLHQLRAVCAEADVVHVHSLWTFPVWWGCRCALRARKPLVMSPRGALNPVYLKHSAWKKRLVGWIDRWCLRRAAVVHATSEMERGWVTDYCGHLVAAMGSVKRARDGRGDSQEAHYREREERIAVIPNGVVLRGSSLLCECISSLVGEEDENSQRSSGGRKTILYLGRLHPLKGLDLLVEAWGRVRSSLVHYCDSALVAYGQKMEGGGQEMRDEGRETDNNARMNSITNDLAAWRLVIAGSDEQGTLKALKAQVVRLGLEESVLFPGPVYGEAKERLLRTADVFVLPTRSENFGIVVAEALACGVPVITTKGAPWSELQGYCDHPVVAMGRVKNGDHSVTAMTSVKTGEGRETETHALINSRINELPPVCTGRAGWWVGVGVEPLAEALREAVNLTDEERQIMGENGRRLVESKYRWETVAERMAAVYSACLRG